MNTKIVYRLTAKTDRKSVYLAEGPIHKDKNGQEYICSRYVFIPSGKSEELLQDTSTVFNNTIYSEGWFDLLDYEIEETSFLSLGDYLDSICNGI